MQDSKPCREPIVREAFWGTGASDPMDLENASSSDLACLPAPPRPLQITSLQHWLDLCA